MFEHIQQPSYSSLLWFNPSMQLNPTQMLPLEGFTAVPPKLLSAITFGRFTTKAENRFKIPATFQVTSIILFLQITNHPEYMHKLLSCSLTFSLSGRN